MDKYPFLLIMYMRIKYNQRTNTASLFLPKEC